MEGFLSETDGGRNETKRSKLGEVGRGGNEMAIHYTQQHWKAEGKLGGGALTY